MIGEPGTADVLKARIQAAALAPGRLRERAAAGALAHGGLL